MAQRDPMQAAYIKEGDGGLGHGVASPELHPAVEQPDAEPDPA